MRGRILSIAVFLLTLFSTQAISQEASENSTKYAEITVPRATVRETVHNKSKMVAIVNRGAVYEIIQEGNLWMQIDTDEGRGWVSITDCRILDHKPTSILSSTGHTVAFIAIIVLGVTVILVFALRRKEDEDLF